MSSIGWSYWYLSQSFLSVAVFKFWFSSTSSTIKFCFGPLLFLLWFLSLQHILSTLRKSQWQVSLLWRRHSVAYLFKAQRCIQAGYFEVLTYHNITNSIALAHNSEYTLILVLTFRPVDKEAVHPTSVMVGWTPENFWSTATSTLSSQLTKCCDGTREKMLSVGRSLSLGAQQWLTTTARWEEWTHQFICLGPTKSAGKPGGGTLQGSSSYNSCTIHKMLWAKQHNKQQSHQEDLCAHLLGVSFESRCPPKPSGSYFPASTSNCRRQQDKHGHQRKVKLHSVQKQKSSSVSMQNESLSLSRQGLLYHLPCFLVFVFLYI